MKIWEFYENLNEIVYAVNIKDYTIEYLNTKALKTLGYRSLEEVKGKKCYHILQDKKERCSFCKTECLKEGEFFEWDYYNPLVKHMYNLKDTLVTYDHEQYQMEIAIDITRQLHQRESIQHYISNEVIVNEALRYALEEQDPDQSIQVLLEYLGKMFDSERAFIFEFMKNDCISNTYEWCTDNVESYKEKLQNLPSSMINQWMEKFNKNEHIVIKNIEKIKNTDPEVYQCLKDQKISSILLGPIQDKDRMLGFYGLDNPPTHKMENISVLIYIISSFIVSFLKKKSMVSELERLSFYDQMTGLKNRHALKDYICNQQIEESIAVIYTDISGLKYINDTYGHDAGDRLLLQAVKCLNDMWGQHSIYRLGGDEFLVIIENKPRQLMEIEIAEFKDSLEKNKVNMSVGYVWSEDKKESLDELIKRADMEMYIEKRKYYRKF